MNKNIEISQINEEKALEQFSVIDLFCGVGGLTRGLIEKGFQVDAGIDFDKSCEYAFEANNKSEFIHKNISDVTSDELIALYQQGKRRILVGCAPCQPFSSHSHKIKRKKNIQDEDVRWNLLYEFMRLIKGTSPEIISMENVPQLINHKVFSDFVSNLKEEGYYVSDYEKPIYCPDYGIAQKRQRLVLLASKLGPISMINPTYQKGEYLTVEKQIANLLPLQSGEYDPNDLLHRARKLSDLNLKRIEAIKEGENWTNLSDDLISPCHKKENGKKFTVAYGRMRWNEQSPTITTHCIGFSNGRFGHPVQNRAISLREAALLQSFPPKYDFIEDKNNVNVTALARHIGNAVPPKLGEAIGLSIINHINKFSYQTNAQ